MSAASRISPAATRVDVCVCTFRRPALEATLRSLGAMRVPEGVALRLIVADNDLEPSAEPLVRRLSAEIGHEIVYRHAPAQNISIARNACLDAADGDFAAFIDDDETATPGWLEALLETAGTEGADAVLGPVRATYAPEAPGWMRKGDFHSTFPVFVAGGIRTGYTCNVLLRRAAPSIAGRRFALSLGRSGGEDTEFFTGLHAAGGRIAYAPEAWVEEPVPAGRASFSWLARRRFRMGQTHGRIVIGPRRPLDLAGQVLLAAGKAGVCVAGAVALLPSAPRRNRFALRAVMHAGVVSGLLGVEEIRQYGEIEPAEGKANAA